MSLLATMILAEAAKPGLQSRAGLALEVRCRKQLATYFNALADALALADTEVAAVLLSHGNALVAQASQRLEDILTSNGKAAYLYEGHMSVLRDDPDVAAGASNKAQAGRSALATPQAIDLQVAIQFDRVGPTAQAAATYARERAAIAVKDIDATSRTTIRRIVSEGITSMKDMPGVARELRKAFKDMASYRAKSIATTETNMAMSTAAYDKIKRVGLPYKRWIVALGACPICQANANQGAIPVDQPFQSGHMYPPAHPGKCRCSISGVREERKDDYRPEARIGSGDRDEGFTA